MQVIMDTLLLETKQIKKSELSRALLLHDCSTNNIRFSDQSLKCSWLPHKQHVFMLRPWGCCHWHVGSGFVTKAELKHCPNIHLGLVVHGCWSGIQFQFTVVLCQLPLMLVTWFLADMLKHAGFASPMHCTVQYSSCQGTVDGQKQSIPSGMRGHQPPTKSNKFVRESCYYTVSLVNDKIWRCQFWPTGLIWTNQNWNDSLAKALRRHWLVFVIVRSHERGSSLL